MKILPSTSWLLSVLVLLCGCGGGVRTFYPSSAPVQGPSSDLPAPGRNITGNWQFSTMSTAGMPPLTIAGSISQSGSSLSGAVHVDGSSCFDQRTAIALTGTLTNGNVSLTSTAVDGQVIALAGSITEKSGFPDSLTGTYTINGGCADGDQGNSAGYNVNSLTGYWAGNLTTAGGQTIHWDTQLNQNGPTVEGSSGLSGPFTFDDACVKSGTITPGTFPSASFIMGTSVVLEIKTDNGTMAFLGTMEPYGLIEGNYTVSGGACESAGTGYLSPWEY